MKRDKKDSLRDDRQFIPVEEERRNMASWKHTLVFAIFCVAFALLAFSGKFIRFWYAGPVTFWSNIVVTVGIIAMMCAVVFFVSLIYRRKMDPSTKK